MDKPESSFLKTAVALILLLPAVYSTHRPLHKMLKAETAENTPSAFPKERTSTHWQYGIPSIFPAYPVSALELQHNTLMWLYGPNTKLSSKKKSCSGDWLFGDNQTILKKTMQIKLGHMKIKRYLPFCLVCVRTVKELPTYQHPQRYYWKDKSARSVTGHTVLAASYRMDWLDTCKTIGRILLTKLPVRDGLMLPYVSYHE